MGELYRSCCIIGLIFKCMPSSGVYIDNYINLFHGNIYLASCSMEAWVTLFLDRNVTLHQQKLNGSQVFGKYTQLRCTVEVELFDACRRDKLRNRNVILIKYQKIKISALNFN